jgi:hypothetical protein
VTKVAYLVCDLWDWLGIVTTKKFYYLFCGYKCFDVKRYLVDPQGAEICFVAQGDIKLT